jgi:predicted ester cyclase
MSDPRDDCGRKFGRSPHDVLGTHAGRFDVASRTLLPTGKKIFDSEILFFHLSDGKITEIRATWDRLSVLEQLGAIPRLEA